MTTSARVSSLESVWCWTRLGVWDKVEAAGFPVKIGGSYTWGKDADVWDFDFFPAEEFVDEPRPARFEGQRKFTAFQVDRFVYDEILLRHAASVGVEVRERTHVREVLLDGDFVTGLRLESGEVVRARHYVDATGHVGLFRRALGIGSTAPEELRNVAFWDYYDDAEWAIRIGAGATRVQIRSLPYGWIWFIPISETKASVGLVCPSEHYRKSGLTPKELFLKAMNEQAEVRHLLRHAKSTSGGEVQSTKNWSHLSDRLAGGNWWICGEAAGFADPILSAGMTLAHNSGRELAYCINEVEIGEEDGDWVRSWYDTKNRKNIEQHIRFAKYWYAANSCFTDLQEHCSKIAKDSGLRLSPAQAWRWLAQGGFANQNIQTAGVGSFDVASAKSLIERFMGGKAKFSITDYNEFRLNLRGAERFDLATPSAGRIVRVPCYKRGEAVLPITGDWRTMIDVLEQEKDIKTIVERLQRSMGGMAAGGHRIVLTRFLQILEVMYTDGWVTAKYNKTRPTMTVQIGGRTIRSMEESLAAAENAKSEIVFNKPTE